MSNWRTATAAAWLHIYGELVKLQDSPEITHHVGASFTEAQPGVMSCNVQSLEQITVLLYVNTSYEYEYKKQQQYLSGRAIIILCKYLYQGITVVDDNRHADFADPITIQQLQHNFPCVCPWIICVCPLINRPKNIRLDLRRHLPKNAG